MIRRGHHETGDAVADLVLVAPQSAALRQCVFGNRRASRQLVAATVILLPDLSRISNAFFTHDALERADLRPPYVSAPFVWYHRALKFGLIVLAVLYPAYETIESWSSSKKPGFFGDYVVEEFQSPLEDTNPATRGAESDSQLKKFNFLRLPYAMEEDQEHDFTDIISIASAQGAYSNATVELNSQTMEMNVLDFQGREKISLTISKSRLSTRINCC